MTRPRSNSMRRAFTLIEMAVVLIIVGMMVGLVLQTEQAVKPENCRVQTQEQLAAIHTAMETYVRANNKYPTPASRAIGVTNLAFGRAVDVTDLTELATIDDLGTVLTGALPFQTLGLSESYASDCWGNKFSYFVTQVLTSDDSSTGFPSPNTSGAINIKTGTILSDVPVMSGASYAVVSHGENGVGAVAKNGTGGANHGWCIPATAADTENCDGSSRTEPAGNTTIFSAPYNASTAAGGAFFDDLVIFAGKRSSNCNATSYSVTGMTWGSCSQDDPDPLAITGPLANGATYATPIYDNFDGITPFTHYGTAYVKCVDGQIVLDSTGYTCGSSCVIGGSNPVCLAPCSTDTLTWGSGCEAEFSGIGSGLTSPSTANTASGLTGAATVTCTNGTWGAPSGTCTGNSCPTQTLTWNTNCSASFTTIASGATSASTANTAAGYTGAATATCTNGAWSTPTGTCSTASCPTQTLTWNTNCSASFTTIASGATSASTANTAAGYTGAATATCTGGTWGTPTGTCTPAACTTTTLSWSGDTAGCSASFTAIASGTTSASTSNTVVGKTGAATATCTNGTWSSPSGTCAANCSAATLSWGAGCSASFAGANSGVTSPSTSNTAGGYSGSATALCTNGAWGAPSGTCTGNSCSTSTRSWGAGCSASFTGIASGATSPSTSNTAAGYTGAATATCTAGTWGAASGTCAVANCPATSLTWGSGCSATFPLAASGAHTRAATNAGYWGSGSSTCTAGSWGATTSAYCGTCAGTPYAYITGVSACFYAGAAGESCTTVCATHGAYSSLTGGPGGQDTWCRNTANAVLGGAYAAPTTVANAHGCYLDTGSGLLRRGTMGSTAASSAAGVRRICACTL